MTKPHHRLLLPFVLALGLTTPLSAADLVPLRQWMQSLVDSGKVVGCMAQVTHGGETVYLEAIGDRTPASDDELEVDQVVRIYSMSKPITSAAIMQLIERGRLGLDDPVAMYIPEFAHSTVASGDERVPLRRPITIRDLLTHTSGLAYSFSAPPELVPQYDRVFSDVATLKDAGVKMAALPLATQPGESFTYGVNTDVLGRVVEVVTGEGFEAYLQANIFEPLGMNDTGFSPDEDLAPMHIVTPHDGTLVIDAEHYANTGRDLNPNFPSGGGGLWSTLADYSRFCMAMEQGGSLDGNQILRDDTVAFMAQNHLSPGMDGGQPVGMQFGLGFGLNGPVETSFGPRGAGRWTWGGAACTYFFIDPAQDVTAVFATQQFPFNFQLNSEFHQVVLESMPVKEQAPAAATASD